MQDLMRQAKQKALLELIQKMQMHEHGMDEGMGHGDDQGMEDHGENNKMSLPKGELEIEIESLGDGKSSPEEMDEENEADDALTEKKARKAFMGQSSKMPIMGKTKSIMMSMGNHKPKPKKIAL